MPDWNIISLKNMVRSNRILRGIVTRVMISRDFPAVIGVDPASTCNLACTFCGPRLMSEPRGVMPLSLFAKLIDEIAAHKKLWMLILHNFGEPLMNPDLAAMVALAKKQRVARSVQFATNATLLTEEKSRALIDARLDGIVLSVDALTREEYRELKGMDLLDTVRENACTLMSLKRRLRSAKPHVCAKMVRRQDYAHTFKPFLREWRTIVDEAALTSYSNWGDAVDYNGTQKQLPPRYACHFLWYYPAVNWDGRVFFCCAACDPSAVIGDLKDQSLSEIWHGERLAQVRKAHLEKRFSDISVCARCTYWSESGVNLDPWLKKKMELPS
jgi:radical SAM protein with 4Fe4S-binding SPASM domain